NRSGSENLTLAIQSPHSIPYRHGNTACHTPRHVGTAPARNASLYSGTGSACGGIGGHGAGVTRAQPRLAGAAEPDLAELLPPTKPVVTEYQWHQLVCATCGEVTRASWPESVPSGTYGPRVQATVALCTGSYRLSKRTTQQVMEEVFGVPMSVGTISPLEQATTEALAAPVEAARTYVQAQEVAHLDETSWRQGGKRAWLWVAVTSLVTVFVVRMSRGGHVARALLGEDFSGILVTDRYSAYNWYPVRWRQVCWAHLLRDFEAMRGRGGASE